VFIRVVRVPILNKYKITTGIGALLVLFGGYITQMQTCTRNAVIGVAQVSQNPETQVAAVEATSFVANLFYQGADDPFPTLGAGGELGKIGKKLLRKGIDNLFEPALKKVVEKTGVIIETARKWKSPQIQEGARAIHKKIGHASKANANYNTAFAGVDISQANAEKLIHEIIEEAEVIVLRDGVVKIYRANGQGLTIKAHNAKFEGFVERVLETEIP